jgi:amidohydrolase
MCGHDGHMTLLLGAISRIQDNLSKIPSNRSVRAIFQPGEEGHNGAKKMVADGALENVDEIYGLHNWPYKGKEQVRVADKEMMAGALKVCFKVIGKGGHGSSPEKCLNPVPISCEVYLKWMSALE